MAVPRSYLAAVQAASQKYHVPAELLAAQIQAESNWNKDAKSPAGAVGISQFMPGTAKGYGIDPHDPIASIDAQGKMMGGLLHSYYGNVDKALAAYNAGAGAVAKYGGVPPYEETHNYIKNIHSYEANYPGLKAGKSAGVSPQAVTRASQYANIIASTGSVVAPKASSASAPSDSLSDTLNPAGGLLGYLIGQSKPGHGASDPTEGLLSILQQSAQQAAATGLVPSTVVPSKGKTVVPSSTAPMGTGPSPVVGGKGGYKLIGTPNQGTHTLYGNWESDNAIDIAVPANTPVYATEDGTIGSRIGHINTKDAHMAGARVNLAGKDNNFYYQHLQTVSVKAGQKVHKGDLLGYSGALNHVHFAVEKGDPRNYYK